jgi:hypothetical protein
MFRSASVRYRTIDGKRYLVYERHVIYKKDAQRVAKSAREEGYASVRLVKTSTGYDVCARAK